jgi:hypothetical protein
MPDHLSDLRTRLFTLTRDRDHINPGQAPREAWLQAASPGPRIGHDSAGGGNVELAARSLARDPVVRIAETRRCDMAAPAA